MSAQPSAAAPQADAKKPEEKKDEKKADEKKAEEKKEFPGPKVLILGGAGFIGRALVKYLVDNKLCGNIRVVDKCVPILHYNTLYPEHAPYFSKHPQVEFIQADLTKDGDVTNKAFKGAPFDYVVNLCGETRFKLPDAEYKVKNYEAAVKAATQAAKMGCKKFVEVSTAQVYEGASKRADEKSKLGPWTMSSKYRLQAEQAIQKISNLPHVILRPALVYGPGDVSSLGPRLVVAAVYAAKLKKTMEFLWGKDLKLNTVHVDDVVRAIWLACTEFASGSVFNLADNVDLDQGKLNGWLGNMFKVKTDFYNSITSNLAKLSLGSVADSANGDHVPAWSAMCEEAKITKTPLSPYIDQELLSDKHISVDGSKIKQTSFRDYSKNITPELVKEQLNYFMQNKALPVMQLF